MDLEKEYKGGEVRVRILVVVLGIVMILLWIKLKFLYGNIKDVKEQLNSIRENPDLNLQIKLSSPDRNMEAMLTVLNEELAKQQKRAIAFGAERLKLKREIANISHDLRTPLTSILGYVELLESDIATETEQKAYVTIIKKKSILLRTLIENFYDLSCMESEDYMMKTEYLDIYALTCEVVLAFYPDFEQKQIEMNIELQEHMNPVWLDEHAMIRIFTNLIQNVLRYGKSQCNVKVFQKESVTCVQIENDTAQFDEHMLEFMFDRTYTQDMSRTDGSMGIGLTIVKILVEKQGGKIRAEMSGTMLKIQIEFYQ